MRRRNVWHDDALDVHRAAPRATHTASSDSLLNRHANRVRVEIGSKRGLALFWRCQRNIAIRPVKIESVSTKIRLLHRRLRRELMEWEVTLRTERPNLRHRAAVDVDLPFE